MTSPFPGPNPFGERPSFGQPSTGDQPPFLDPTMATANPFQPKPFVGKPFVASSSGTSESAQHTTHSPAPQAAENAASDPGRPGAFANPKFIGAFFDELLQDPEAESKQVLTDDCRAMLARLYHFLDGELTHDRRAAIQNHLDGCVPCLSVFDFEAELRMVVMDRARTTVPSALEARIRLSLIQCRDEIA